MAKNMRLITRNRVMFSLIVLISISENSLAFQSVKLRNSSRHLCLHDQNTALIKLKEDVLRHYSDTVTFDENSSMKVEGWNPRTDCCIWNGVTCDDSGFVVGLNLSYSKISGHIDAIFTLHHLQSLNLAGNNFQLNPIPSGFDRLTDLMRLNLSDSCFSDQIPEGIAHLTKLSSLDLSTISFCELPPTFNDPDFNHVFAFEELHRFRLEKPNIESFFRNLSDLRELYLDYVDLSSQGSNWSQALSINLPNLQVLSLSHCRLSGAIHGSFENLKSIRYIKLDGNNLFSEVPPFFASFRDLELLNLASCQLFGTFPRNVFLLPRLQTIDISKNQNLTGEFPEFPLNSSLQLLSLYLTNFQGKLPDSIGILQSLTILLLYTCNFSGLIPPSLANLTRIAELDISYNNLHGSIPAFRNSSVPKLSDLRLSFNLLTGTIDPSIFTLSSLKIVYLNDNRLSGKLVDFPAHTSSLNELYLNGNELSGQIPRSISEIPSLSFISLAANNFSGTIKLDTFQNLMNLTSLDLSMNKLDVEISQTDLIFPQLQELKLSRCNLTEFPAFLKKQDQLRVLNLSSNQIQGFVPQWLWASSLEELDLSQNEVAFLEEDITLSRPGKLVMRSCNVTAFPEFLKVADNLWYLDLSDNTIDGRLPAWLWKSTMQYVNVSHNSLSFIEEFYPNISLNSLTTLDLRGNLLQGLLPHGICNLSSLSIFDASRNNLTGSIPECLGTMGNLSVLNLQGNKHQRLPLNFSAATSLRSLNVNSNLLKGRMPRSLADCKMLEVLDLGNNMITDSFPSWLHKLPYLKVLVLKNNRFFGQIQLPTSKISLSKLGIIDISSNNFSGEVPKRFLESLDEMGKNRKMKSAPEIIGQYESYQDSVTIMSKGTEMVLVRILTIFVSLDLSNNSFHGTIPSEIGTLKSLVVLNLSRNAFGGAIPSSLGELSELESLDLARNNLSGAIPQRLPGLTFLSFFNISYNYNLEGRIPEGNQFNTYNSDSYLGNPGLCGPPLSKKCQEDDDLKPELVSGDGNSEYGTLFNWNFALAGYGFGMAVGLTLGCAFLPNFQYVKGRSVIFGRRRQIRGRN